MYAALNGHEKVVKYLLEKGANASSKDKVSPSSSALASILQESSLLYYSIILILSYCTSMERPHWNTREEGIRRKWWRDYSSIRQAILMEKKAMKTTEEDQLLIVVIVVVVVVVIATK